VSATSLPYSLYDTAGPEAWWRRGVPVQRAADGGGRHPLYRWDRARLIQVLQERARELGRTPQRNDFPVAAPEAPHYRTFAYHFGSWTGALRAAGLVGADVVARDLSSSPDWTDAQLLEILRDTARRLGRTPERSDFLRATAGSPHYNTFKRRFGGWRGALEAAGLADPAGDRRRFVGRHWTDRELLAALSREAARLGRPPTSRDFRLASADAPSATTIIKRFGGWRHALAAAGLLPAAGSHQ
jgi:hypothetical protein